MSERVWRQLQAEASVPRDHDAVLRLALCAMAADPTSSLTTAQRQWVLDLGHLTRRFTPQERARLKDPLLTWVHKTMPRCEAIIRKQFPEKDSLG